MNKFNHLLKLPSDWHKTLKEGGVAIDLSNPIDELETLFKNNKHIYTYKYTHIYIYIYSTIVLVIYLLTRMMYI